MKQPRLDDPQKDVQHRTENSRHYTLDWNYDEDRGRIRTDFGPKDVSRVRRFAIVLTKSSTEDGVAQ